MKPSRPTVTPRPVKALKIIAEVGSVHDGSFGNAQKAIEAAARFGVDVVKFQTHIAEAETLKDAPNPPYFQGEPRFDYFKRTGFTPDQWKALKTHCEKSRVEFLSSPFSLEAVDLLESIGVQSYKIPSGEVTNLPLLHRVARTHQTVYLSSGMSTWAELDAAVSALKRGKGRIVVMQCSSRYPCKPEEVGLNVLGEMKTRYGLEVGFSDHTLGMAASIAAVALGATVIEKHFTFSKLMYGSDAQHSMEPDELTALVKALREAHAIITHPVDKSSTAPYAEMKSIFEKSVVSAQALPKGTVLELKHLAFKKPGTGISAAHYESLIGKRVKRDIPADRLIQAEELE